MPRIVRVRPTPPTTETANMADIKIKVSEIEYHRNGISGEGFYAVRFASRVCDASLDFLATVFDRPGCGSVICLDAIADHAVAARGVDAGVAAADHAAGQGRRGRDLDADAGARDVGHRRGRPPAA